MTTATATIARTKRQKRVFKDSRQVAHVWAQQIQEYGCNPSRNIYFEGDTIYSYGSHFPIARFAGRGVVLINRNCYSVTTSGHQRDVEDSLRGLDVQKIYVDDPCNYSSAANLESLWADLIATAKQHAMARQRDYRVSLRSQLANLAAYAKFAKRGRTKQLAAIVAAAKRDDQFWAPLARLSIRAAKEIDAEKAKREKQAEKQSAERRDRERRIWERGQAMSAAFAPLAQEAWRNGDATFRLPAELAQQFDDCLSATEKQRGVLVERYVRNGWDSTTMLRVVGDEIEMSRGARVPVRDAKLAWAALRRREVPQDRIGYFRPEGFDNGDFLIGCHRIPISELNRIASQLGLEGQIAD
jgi:hypothetical protein